MEKDFLGFIIFLTHTLCCAYSYLWTFYCLIWWSICISEQHILFLSVLVIYDTAGRPWGLQLQVTILLLLLNHRIAFALLHKRPECFWINILIMWCLRETPCYYMWFDLICHACYFNLIYMCNEMLSPKETNACDHTSPIMARFISLFNYVPCMYYSPLLPFLSLKNCVLVKSKRLKRSWNLYSMTR